MAAKVIIVGGVAGGASAAARLRRLDEDAEIILVEQGEYVSFANCGLPYYIGGTIARRDKLLVQTPEALKARFHIDVRIFSQVLAIHPEKKTVVIREVTTGQTYEESYDQLILSPGASPMRPDFPGAHLPNVFTLRNLPDTDRIKTFLTEQKPQRALVVGSGFIGVEMIENLTEAGVQVTAVELSPQVLPPLDPEMAAIVQRGMSAHGVELLLGVGLEGIEQRDDGLECILSDGTRKSTDMVLLSIGVRPDNVLAREAGLELGPNGSIAVDEYLRTSQPDIYAVGDAIAAEHFVLGGKAVVPLAGPANRQGRLAADNLSGRPGVYSGTLGTAVVKVFDLVAGATGANEKQLRSAGRAYDKVYIHPNSHAGYYPGGATLSMKLLFDPADGKILGAQAVGADGVDKRIDVLATALRAGLTVFDLEQLELSYAPPFSSAKDPVNMLGFTAANVIKKDFTQCFIEDLASMDPEREVLVDIRTPAEYAQGTIGNAVNIELDAIRDRLDEFPKDKRLVLFCRAGLRGYVGCRILSQRGFDVANLSGGYLTWWPVYGTGKAPK